MKYKHHQGVQIPLNTQLFKFLRWWMTLIALTTFLTFLDIEAHVHEL